MKKLIILAASLLLAVLTACGNLGGPPAQPAAETVTITDMTGRKVTVKTPVKTYALSTFDLINFVVPLKGKQAFEMLAGVGDSGGKPAYDRMYEPLFPGLKQRLAIISGHNAPFDVEAILAKKPDVLIVNSAMQAHMHALKIESRLQEAGIALVLVDVPKVADKSVPEALYLFGQIFGEPEKAREVAGFINEQFADIHARLSRSKQPKPVVYYEKSGTAETFGPSSLSNSSGWGSLIQIAGGDNLADQAVGSKRIGSSVVLDPELVIRSNPDYILLSGVNELGMAVDANIAKAVRFDIIKRAGWAELKAVRHKNVYEYQHELQRSVFLFYPALSLAKLFYPEEFRDVDPEQRLAEFYDRFMLIKSTDGIWKLKLE